MLFAFVVVGRFGVAWLVVSLFVLGIDWVVLLVLAVYIGMYVGVVRG